MPRPRIVDTAKLARLWDTGMPLRQLATAMGVTDGCISYWARRLKLPHRVPPEARHAWKALGTYDTCRRCEHHAGCSQPGRTRRPVPCEVVLEGEPTEIDDAPVLWPSVMRVME